MAILWLARVKMPRAGVWVSASKSEEERKTWGQQAELPGTSWPVIKLVNSGTLAPTNNMLLDRVRVVGIV